MRTPTITPQLPDSLRGTCPGFTRHSIMVRLPSILQQMIDHCRKNNYAFVSDPQVMQQLERVDKSLREGGNIFDLKPSPDAFEKDGGPDWSQYEAKIAHEPKKTWIDLPWWFIETYFYRLVLSIIGYYKHKQDPFEPQKQKALADCMSAIRTIEAFDPDQQSTSAAVIKKNFMYLLYADLWSNRADLSFSGGKGIEEDEHRLEKEKENILVDQAEALWQRLQQIKEFRRQHNSSAQGETNIYFVLDNCGLELVSDILLADMLLSYGFTDKVTFYCKAHPVFVSDAMIKDVMYTLEQLANRNNGNGNGNGNNNNNNDDDDHQQQQDEHMVAIARRFLDPDSGYIAKKQFELKESDYWMSPLAWWEMPEPLAAELASSHLVFVKGDANYRRLVGDLKWDYTTSFEDLLCSYLVPPSPSHNSIGTALVALRTLKAEVACLGPQAAQRIDHLNAHDPQWLSNGKYGLIQYVCIEPAAAAAATATATATATTV